MRRRDTQENGKRIDRKCNSPLEAPLAHKPSIYSVRGFPLVSGNSRPHQSHYEVDGEPTSDSGAYTLRASKVVKLWSCGYTFMHKTMILSKIKTWTDTFIADFKLDGTAEYVIKAIENVLSIMHRIENKLSESVPNKESWLFWFRRRFGIEENWCSSEESYVYRCSKKYVNLELCISKNNMWIYGLPWLLMSSLFYFSFWSFYCMSDISC